MFISKRVRTLGMATLIAGVPLAAMAQSQPQPAPESTSPPAATRPDPAPMPPPSPTPSTKPTDPAQKPMIDRKPNDKSATAPAPAAKVNPMIGLAVFSSDGNKLGTVHSVDAQPDGKVKALRVKTGGFLGFGGKLVAIPEGKFTRSGENIQLGMTAEEVSKLPEIKDQS